MIVRLKVMIRPNGRGQFEDFNSMIVRLKAFSANSANPKNLISIL